MANASRVTEYDALLNETQAAQILNLSIRTLQAWRVRGSGPVFIQAGRAVRYRRTDIFQWVEAHTSRRTGGAVR